MKKILVNGIESEDSTVILNNANVEVKFNDANFQIYGEHNDVVVFSNSSNLHIYGDYNKVKVKANDSNLHIYGDHLSISVENNECNLHIYGTHVNVFIEKGMANVYGDYGNVTLEKDAKAEVFGAYKKVNKISE
jgi:hypothetical protein